jgi:hypothetical protein
MDKNYRHANQLSEMLRVLQNAWPMNLLMLLVCIFLCNVEIS